MIHLFPFLLLAVRLLLNVSETRSQNPLPNHIEPIHYDVELHIDTNSDKYWGRVEIFVKVTDIIDSDESEWTNLHDRILFNAGPNLQISKASLITYRGSIESNIPSSSSPASISQSSHDQTEIPDHFDIADVAHELDHSLIILTVNDQLVKGMKFGIEMEFMSSISSSSPGILYVDRYLRTNKTLRSLFGSGSYENTRNIFPCFDDPKFRSSFTLNVVQPLGLVAISNTSPIVEQISETMNAYMFRQTIAMATNSFFVFISELNSSEHNTGDPNATTLARASLFIQHPTIRLRNILDFHSEAMAEVEIYFQHPFPAQKVDYIPMPMLARRSYTFWGAIVMNVHRFLYEYDHMTNERGFTTSLMLEGLVKHWIGFLWSVSKLEDSWFPIGVSNSIAVDLGTIINDRYNFKLDWQFERNIEWMRLDSEHDIDITLQDKSLYMSRDHKLYTFRTGKSLSVMRLFINSLIGREHFQDKLIDFLRSRGAMQANSNGFVEQPKTFIDILRPDLWNHILPWLLNPGHPVIMIDIDISHQMVRIDQKRYQERTTNIGIDDSSIYWPIPIKLLICSALDHCFDKQFIVPPRPRFYYTLPAWTIYPDVWLSIQEIELAPYRLILTERSLELLKGALQANRLSVNSLHKLLNDIRRLVKMGHLSPHLWFGYLKFFKHSDDPKIIRAMVRAFKDTINTFLHTDLWKRYLSLGLHILKIFHDGNLLFIPTTDVEIRTARIDLAMLLLDAEDKNFIDTALHLFDSDLSRVPDYLLGTVLATVTSYGTDDQFHRALHILNSKPTEAFDITLSMAKSTNKNRLIRIFNTLEDRQCIRIFFQVLSTTSVGQDLMIELMHNQDQRLFRAMHYSRGPNGILLSFAKRTKLSIDELDALVSAKMGNLWRRDILTEVQQERKIIEHKMSFYPIVGQYLSNNKF